MGEVGRCWSPRRARAAAREPRVQPERGLGRLRGAGRGQPGGTAAAHHNGRSAPPPPSPAARSHRRRARDTARRATRRGGEGEGVTPPTGPPHRARGSAHPGQGHPPHPPRGAPPRPGKGVGSGGESGGKGGGKFNL